MPHGGTEEYIVIEPNFRMGVGGIPATYQAEVILKENTTTEEMTSSPSTAVSEGVIATKTFISRCVTIVNECASSLNNMSSQFYRWRQELLELDNIITIPHGSDSPCHPLTLRIMLVQTSQVAMELGAKTTVFTERIY